MPFRRSRLALKYASLIEIMMGSVTRSGVSFMLHSKPELLKDGTLRAVDMMFDNARQAGDVDRADRLAVIRKVLMDAGAGHRCCGRRDPAKGATAISALARAVGQMRRQAVRRQAAWR